MSPPADTKKLPENITNEWLEAHKAATAKLINDVEETFKAWKAARQKFLSYRALQG